MTTDIPIVYSPRLTLPDLSIVRSDDEIERESEAFLSLYDEIEASPHSKDNVVARLSAVNICSALFTGEWPSVERLIHALPEHLKVEGSSQTFEELAVIALESYYDTVDLNRDPRNALNINRSKRNFHHIIDQLVRFGLAPGLGLGVVEARLAGVKIYRKSRLDYSSAPTLRGYFNKDTKIVSTFMSNPFLDRTHIPHELTHVSLEGAESDSPFLNASRGITEAIVQHIADRGTAVCLKWDEDQETEGLSENDQKHTMPWVPDYKSTINSSGQYIFLDPRLFRWEGETSYKSERNLMYALARLAGRGAGVIDFIEALIDSEGGKVEALDSSLTEALSGALPLGRNQTVLSWVKENTEGEKSDELSGGLPDLEKAGRVLEVVREATGTNRLSRLATWKENKRVRKNLALDVSGLQVT